MAVDVLSVVYAYVMQFATTGTDEAPQTYTDQQVVIGQQNAAVLPADVAEFCVITHTGTIRHGTTITQDTTADDSDDGTASATENIEHLITVQMYSAEPQTPQYETATRAQILEMMSRTEKASSFFRDNGLALLYAEDVRNVPGWDETKTYTACYTLTLHLAELLTVGYNEDYFDAVTVRSVDAHTVDTRTSLPGVLLTENIDNNHK